MVSFSENFTFSADTNRIRALGGKFGLLQTPYTRVSFTEKCSQLMAPNTAKIVEKKWIRIFFVYYYKKNLQCLIVANKWNISQPTFRFGVIICFQDILDRMHSGCALLARVYRISHKAANLSAWIWSFFQSSRCSFESNTSLLHASEEWPPTLVAGQVWALIPAVDRWWLAPFPGECSSVHSHTLGLIWTEWKGFC